MESLPAVPSIYSQFNTQIQARFLNEDGLQITSQRHGEGEERIMKNSDP